MAEAVVAVVTLAVSVQQSRKAAKSQEKAAERQAQAQREENKRRSAVGAVERARKRRQGLAAARKAQGQIEAAGAFGGALQGSGVAGGVGQQFTQLAANIGTNQQLGGINQRSLGTQQSLIESAQDNIDAANKFAGNAALAGSIFNVASGLAINKAAS